MELNIDKYLCVNIGIKEVKEVRLQMLDHLRRLRVMVSDSVDKTADSKRRALSRLVKIEENINNQYQYIKSADRLVFKNLMYEKLVGKISEFDIKKQIKKINRESLNFINKKNKIPMLKDLGLEDKIDTLNLIKRIQLKCQSNLGKIAMEKKYNNRLLKMRCISCIECLNDAKEEYFRCKRLGMSEKFIYSIMEQYLKSLTLNFPPLVLSEVPIRTNLLRSKRKVRIATKKTRKIGNNFQVLEEEVLDEPSTFVCKSKIKKLDYEHKLRWKKLRESCNVPVVKPKPKKRCMDQQELKSRRLRFRTMKLEKYNYELSYKKNYVGKGINYYGKTQKVYDKWVQYSTAEGAFWPMHANMKGVATSQLDVNGTSSKFNLGDVTKSQFVLSPNWSGRVVYLGQSIEKIGFYLYNTHVLKKLWKGNKAISGSIIIDSEGNVVGMVTHQDKKYIYVMVKRREFTLTEYKNSINATSKTVNVRDLKADLRKIVNKVNEVNRDLNKIKGDIGGVSGKLNTAKPKRKPKKKEKKDVKEVKCKKSNNLLKQFLMLFCIIALVFSMNGNPSWDRLNNKLSTDCATVTITNETMEGIVRCVVGTKHKCTRKWQKGSCNEIRPRRHKLGCAFGGPRWPQNCWNNEQAVEDWYSGVENDIKSLLSAYPIEPVHIEVNYSSKCFKVNQVSRCYVEALPVKTTASYIVVQAEENLREFKQLVDDNRNITQSVIALKKKANDVKKNSMEIYNRIVQMNIKYSELLEIIEDTRVQLMNPIKNFPIVVNNNDNIKTIVSSVIDTLNELYVKELDWKERIKHIKLKYDELMSLLKELNEKLGATSKIQQSTLALLDNMLRTKREVEDFTISELLTSFDYAVEILKEVNRNFGETYEIDHKLRLRRSLKLESENMYDWKDNNNVTCTQPLFNTTWLLSSCANKVNCSKSNPLVNSCPISCFDSKISLIRLEYVTETKGCVLPVIKAISVKSDKPTTNNTGLIIGYDSVMYLGNVYKLKNKYNYKCPVGEPSMELLEGYHFGKKVCSIGKSDTVYSRMESVYENLVSLKEKLNLEKAVTFCGIGVIFLLSPQIGVVTAMLYFGSTLVTGSKVQECSVTRLGGAIVSDNVTHWTQMRDLQVGDCFNMGVEHVRIVKVFRYVEYKIEGYLPSKGLMNCSEYSYGCIGGDYDNVDKRETNCYTNCNSHKFYSVFGAKNFDGDGCLIKRGIEVRVDVCLDEFSYDDALTSIHVPHKQTIREAISLDVRGKNYIVLDEGIINNHLEIQIEASSFGDYPRTFIKSGSGVKCVYTAILSYGNCVCKSSPCNLVDLHKNCFDLIVSKSAPFTASLFYIGGLQAYKEATSDCEGDYVVETGAVVLKYDVPYQTVIMTSDKKLSVETLSLCGKFNASVSEISEGQQDYHKISIIKLSITVPVSCKLHVQMTRCELTHDAVMHVSRSVELYKLYAWCYLTSNDTMTIQGSGSDVVLKLEKLSSAWLPTHSKLKSTISSLGVTVFDKFDIFDGFIVGVKDYYSSFIKKGFKLIIVVTGLFVSILLLSQGLIIMPGCLILLTSLVCVVMGSPNTQFIVEHTITWCDVWLSYIVSLTIGYQLFKVKVVINNICLIILLFISLIIHSPVVLLSIILYRVLFHIIGRTLDIGSVRNYGVLYTPSIVGLIVNRLCRVRYVLPCQEDLMYPKILIKSRSERVCNELKLLRNQVLGCNRANLLGPKHKQTKTYEQCDTDVVTSGDDTLYTGNTNFGYCKQGRIKISKIPNSSEYIISDTGEVISTVKNSQVSHEGWFLWVYNSINQFKKIKNTKTKVWYHDNEDIDEIVNSMIVKFLTKIELVDEEEPSTMITNEYLYGALMDSTTSLYDVRDDKFIVMEGGYLEHYVNFLQMLSDKMKVSDQIIAIPVFEDFVVWVDENLAGGTVTELYNFVNNIIVGPYRGVIAGDKLQLGSIDFEQSSNDHILLYQESQTPIPKNVAPKVFVRDEMVAPHLSGEVVLKVMKASSDRCTVNGNYVLVQYKYDEYLHDTVGRVLYELINAKYLSITIDLRNSLFTKVNLNYWLYNCLNKNASEGNQVNLDFIHEGQDLIYKSVIAVVETRIFITDSNYAVFMSNARFNRAYLSSAVENEKVKRAISEWANKSGVSMQHMVGLCYSRSKNRTESYAVGQMLPVQVRTSHTYLDDSIFWVGVVTNASSQGICFGSGEKMVTSHHVTEGQSVFVTCEGSTIQYSLIKSDRPHDVCYYGSEEMKFNSVDRGEIVCAIFPTQGTCQYFICQGVSSSTGIRSGTAFTTFKPIYVDYESKTFRNISWKGQPGLSGSPIINSRGETVGLFGLGALKPVYGADGETHVDEQLIVCSPGAAVMENTDDVFRQAAREQKTLDIGVVSLLVAPTGTGKTTKFTLELAKEYLAAGEKQLIHVLEPTNAAVTNAFNRISDVVLSSRISGIKVNMIASLGNETRSTVGSGNVEIRISTYGKQLVSDLNHNNETRANTLVCDEFHCTSDADVVNYINYLLGLNTAYEHIVLMSATPISIDYQRVTHLVKDVRMKSNFTVVEDSLIPIPNRDEVKAFINRGYFVFETQNLSSLAEEVKAIGYAYSRELMEGRCILFAASKGDCEKIRNSILKHNIKYREHEIVTFYSGKSLDTSTLSCNAIIVATDIAATSITIPDVTIVIDLMTELKPVVECYQNEAGIKYHYRLEPRLIDQSSSQQRMGRTGRTTPGIYVKPKDVECKENEVFNKEMSAIFYLNYLNKSKSFTSKVLEHSSNKPFYNQMKELDWLSEQSLSVWMRNKVTLLRDSLTPADYKKLLTVSPMVSPRRELTLNSRSDPGYLSFAAIISEEYLNSKMKNQKQLGSVGTLEGQAKWNDGLRKLCLVVNSESEAERLRLLMGIDIQSPLEFITITEQVDEFLDYLNVKHDEVVHNAGYIYSTVIIVTILAIVLGIDSAINLWGSRSVTEIYSCNKDVLHTVPKTLKQCWEVDKELSGMKKAFRKIREILSDNLGRANKIRESISGKKVEEKNDSILCTLGVVESWLMANAPFFMASGWPGLGGVVGTLTVAGLYDTMVRKLGHTLTFILMSVLSGFLVNIGGVFFWGASVAAGLIITIVKVLCSSDYNKSFNGPSGSAVVWNNVAAVLLGGAGGAMIKELFSTGTATVGGPIMVSSIINGTIAPPKYSQLGSAVNVVKGVYSLIVKWSDGDELVYDWTDLVATITTVISALSLNLFGGGLMVAISVSLLGIRFIISKQSRKEMLQARTDHVVDEVKSDLEKFDKYALWTLSAISIITCPMSAVSVLLGIVFDMVTKGGNFECKESGTRNFISCSGSHPLVVLLMGVANTLFSYVNSSSASCETQHAWSLLGLVPVWLAQVWGYVSGKTWASGRWLGRKLGLVEQYSLGVDERVTVDRLLETLSNYDSSNIASLEAEDFKMDTDGRLYTSKTPEELKEELKKIIGQVKDYIHVATVKASERDKLRKARNRLRVIKNAISVTKTKFDSLTHCVDADTSALELETSAYGTEVMHLTKSDDSRWYHTLYDYTIGWIIKIIKWVGSAIKDGVYALGHLVGIGVKDGLIGRTLKMQGKIDSGRNSLILGGNSISKIAYQVWKSRKGLDQISCDMIAIRENVKVESGTWPLKNMEHGLRIGKCWCWSTDLDVSNYKVSHEEFVKLIAKYVSRYDDTGDKLVFNVLGFSTSFSSYYNEKGAVAYMQVKLTKEFINYQASTGTCIPIGVEFGVVMAVVGKEGGGSECILMTDKFGGDVIGTFAQTMRCKNYMFRDVPKNLEEYVIGRKLAKSKLKQVVSGDTVDLLFSSTTNILDQFKGIIATLLARIPVVNDNNKLRTPIYNKFWYVCPPGMNPLVHYYTFFLKMRVLCDHDITAFVSAPSDINTIVNTLLPIGYSVRWYDTPEFAICDEVTLVFEVDVNEVGEDTNIKIELDRAHYDWQQSFLWPWNEVTVKVISWCDWVSFIEILGLITQTLTVIQTSEADSRVSYSSAFCECCIVYRVYDGKINCYSCSHHIATWSTFNIKVVGDEGEELNKLFDINIEETRQEYMNHLSTYNVLPVDGDYNGVICWPFSNEKEFKKALKGYTSPDKYEAVSSLYSSITELIDRRAEYLRGTKRLDFIKTRTQVGEMVNKFWKVKGNGSRRPDSGIDRDIGSPLVNQYPCSYWGDIVPNMICWRDHLRDNIITEKDILKATIEGDNIHFEFGEENFDEASTSEDSSESFNTSTPDISSEVVPKVKGKTKLKSIIKIMTPKHKPKQQTEIRDSKCNILGFIKDQLRDAVAKRQEVSDIIPTVGEVKVKNKIMKTLIDTISDITVCDRMTGDIANSNTDEEEAESDTDEVFVIAKEITSPISGFLYPNVRRDPNWNWLKYVDVPLSITVNIELITEQMRKLSVNRSKWERLRYVGRVELPKRDYMGVVYASRGAFKAQQLVEADPNFFDNCYNILDPCCGYGGFEQFMSYYYRNGTNRTLIFNTLLADDHAQPNVDIMAHPGSNVTLVDSRVSFLKGNIEDPEQLKFYKLICNDGSDKKIDLMFFDIGETSNDGKVNYNFWKTKIEIINQYYSELLIEGGKCLFKMNGVYRGSEIILHELTKHFKMVKCIKLGTTPLVSGEYYVYCQGYKKAFNAKINRALYINNSVGDYICQNLGVAAIYYTQRGSYMSPIKRSDWFVPETGGAIYRPKISSDVRPKGGKLSIDNGFRKVEVDWEPRWLERLNNIERYCKKMGFKPFKIHGENKTDFKQLFVEGHIKRKRSEKKERHIVNKLLYDCVARVFKMSRDTATYGHTQSSRKYSKESMVKRLDGNPGNPSGDRLLKLSKTLECMTTKFGHNVRGSVRFLTKEEVVLLVNNKGSTGALDNGANLEQFMQLYPNWYELCWSEIIIPLSKGKTTHRYWTCRPKMEPKEKKNIVDGRIDTSMGTSLEALQEFNNQGHRFIQFSDALSRLADIIMKGHILKLSQEQKIYKGTINGLPPFLQGNVLRVIWDKYQIKENQIFADNPHNLLGVSHECEESKMGDPNQDAAGLMLDYSKWDFTVSVAERMLADEYLSSFYDPKLRPIIMAAGCEECFGITLNDEGDVWLRAGQVASGEIWTGLRNTLLAQANTISAISDVLGKTVEELLETRLVIKASVGEKVKIYELGAISSLSDGDDTVIICDKKTAKTLRKGLEEPLSRSNKCIRSGNEAGAKLAHKFEELMFCSHRYEMTLFGPSAQEVVSQCRNNLRRVYNEVQEIQYYKRLNYRIKYLPIRHCTTIFSKLMMTLKLSTAFWEPNTNTEGRDITISKVMSYILMYPHCRWMRYLGLMIFSYTGDSMDVTNLKSNWLSNYLKSLNINKTTLMGAIGSIYGVYSFNEISLRDYGADVRGLKDINFNISILGRRIKCNNTYIISRMYSWLREKGDKYKFWTLDNRLKEMVCKLRNDV